MLGSTNSELSAERLLGSEWRLSSHSKLIPLACPREPPKEMLVSYPVRALWAGFLVHTPACDRIGQHWRQFLLSDALSAVSSNLEGPVLQGS